MSGPTAKPVAVRPAATVAAAAPETKRAVLRRMTATRKPPRIILNATEGWGKTSTVAHVPDVAILMAAGETGYETLLGAGLVPSVMAARINDWAELLGTLDSIAANPDGIKTVALDAIGGFERMCHELVCDRDYDGDWGEKGFANYQNGYAKSVNDWLQLIVRLDKCWDAGMSIVLLSHCRVRTFKNPLGADYDRYTSDVHEKTWAVTHKWADAVLFGNFMAVVEGGATGAKAKKGKGIGGADRVLYTERRDSFDAKNRYSMPPLMQMPDDPAMVWKEIVGSMKGQ